MLWEEIFIRVGVGSAITTRIGKAGTSALYRLTRLEVATYHNARRPEILVINLRQIRLSYDKLVGLERVVFGRQLLDVHNGDVLAFNIVTKILERGSIFDTSDVATNRQIYSFDGEKTIADPFADDYFVPRGITIPSLIVLV